VPLTLMRIIIRVLRGCYRRQSEPCRYRGMQNKHFIKSKCAHSSAY